MEGHIFGDKRIACRIEELTSSIIEKESVVIHRLAKDEAQQRSFYRLLHNPRLETGQVVEFLRQDCLAQVEAGAHYLVIQDTTQPNFERNRQNISDQRQLGVIGDGASLGFFLHPSLVVCAGTGRCLGFSQVMCWSREAAAPDKVRRAYKSRPIEEKESFRWIQSALSSNGLLKQAGMVTHICDREGDIGELFGRVPKAERSHLLVRSAQERLLAGGGTLSTALEAAPVAGHYTLSLKGDARTGRQQREAVLEVRYCTVRLQLREAELQAVEVREVDAPEGQQPVHWRLLTTHRVGRLEEALEVVEWYSMRWNIEQVFRLLKQKGLGVEALEVETGKGLVQLTLLALFAAAKILLLHLSVRQQEPQPVAGAFSDEQLECLEAVGKQYEGKTERQRNPYPAGTLPYCYWVLARLGGWKPQEKRAGVITLHRGFIDFQKIFDGWRLAKQLVS